MTRAEKIEAAATEYLAAFVAAGPMEECVLRERAALQALRAALAAPASPGPEPRAMEEIEKLTIRLIEATRDEYRTSGSGYADERIKLKAAHAALLAAIRRALGAAPAGAFQRGVEAAAKVLRGVVDSSEEDDRWDAIVAEAESQILDLAHRRPTRSSPGAASPGERGEKPVPRCPERMPGHFKAFCALEPGHAGRCEFFNPSAPAAPPESSGEGG